MANSDQGIVILVRIILKDLPRRIAPLVLTIELVVAQRLVRKRIISSDEMRKRHARKVTIMPLGDVILEDKRHRGND